MDSVPVKKSEPAPKRKGQNIILPLLLILLFIGLSLMVVYYLADPFDVAVGKFIRSFESDSLTKVFTIVTQLASATVLVPLALVISGFLFIAYKQKAQPLLLIFSTGGAFLLQDVLKEIFLRPRPSLTHLVATKTYSFPSGHAACGIAFYGMLGYLVYSALKRRAMPAWYIPIVTSIVIFAIGLSRIYLGVHYLTDVTGGFLLGGFWAMVVFQLVNSYKKTSSIKKANDTHSI